MILRKPSMALLGLAAAFAMLLTGPAHARVKSGDVISFHSNSPNPYPAGNAGKSVVYEEEIKIAGATSLRIHFSQFDLAPGDTLAVSDPKGQQQWHYEGRGPKDRGEFWSFTIEGDTALVSIAAATGGGAGYVIDKVAKGHAIPDLRAICGSDGRKDVACYGSAPSLTIPVVRLSFVDGPFTFVCTGYLVRGPNQNTMMTNQHCIDNQNTLNTAEARFNYRRSACGGFTDSPFLNVGGDTFLKTDVGLDYSLMTLAGDPEGLGATEYVARSAPAFAGERFVLPQHSGGNRKTIAVFEDAAETDPCNVNAVNQSVSGWDNGSQMFYTCDMEGGASGSPVLSAPGLEVIGINHVEFIGCGGSGNVATMMNDICDDAGALLDCS